MSPDYFVEWSNIDPPDVDRRFHWKNRADQPRQVHLVGDATAGQPVGPALEEKLVAALAESSGGNLEAIRPSKRGLSLVGRNTRGLRGGDAQVAQVGLPLGRGPVRA